MIKIRCKLLIILVAFSSFLDMVGTWAAASQMTEVGVSINTVTTLEGNPVISWIWQLSGDVFAGIAINFGFVTISMILILWYLPQKVFPAKDHSLFLGLGLGSAILFTLGFFNNFLLLVTRGMIERFWLGPS